MRIKLAAAAFAAVILLACAGAFAHALKSASPAARKPPREYYLALGDSLARGSQPRADGTTGPTEEGYTNDLFAAEKSKFKNLHFVNLGCPGETTATMIEGGTCRYAGGSQLAAALGFLRKHRGHVAFVTIDIGADDFRGCAGAAHRLRACFRTAEKAVRKGLPRIAGRLRRAAGKQVPIVGMTYYDPILGEWRAGPQGRRTAAQSQRLIKRANKIFASIYRGERLEVAAVADSFRTYEPLSKTERYDGHRLPVAVAVICAKTWMCAPPPRGPDVHANTAGYLKIARAFEREQL